jgi:hypothetical protein
MRRLQTQHSSDKANTRQRHKLRSDTKKAIATLNFESAESFANQLSQQREKELIDLTQHITTEFLQDVKEWIDHTKTQITKASHKATESHSQISFTFHRSFTDMKSKHLCSLSQLENQYATNRLRANDRRVPEQIALLEEAKRSAMEGDFETARRKRDKSREEGQKEIQKRLKELEQKFIEDRTNFFAAQAKMAEELNSRFKEEQLKVARQEEEEIRKSEVMRGEKIRELFETAIGKLRNVNERERGEELWGKLREVCEEFGISNPVVCPTEVAKEEITKKRMALERIQQSISDMQLQKTIKATP